MSEGLNWILLALIIVLVPLLWAHGYFTGKSAGIREASKYLDEQWKCYERFRDLVFEDLGIEVKQ